jgi:uncharacterized protein YcbX
MTASLQAIYRYPVKGLSPEALARAALSPGATLAADRLYAIENGPSGFDPAKPAHLSKTRFLMLMRDEKLASLDTSFDDATHRLTIRQDGAVKAQGDLRSEDGRSEIERFFAHFCAADLKGPPRILQSPGHSFSDVAAKVVSIINLASVAAIEKIVGAAIDPLRFRGNLHVTGWPAWHEFDLLGETLLVGAARLKVVKRITRCAATNVKPGEGIRDMEIPKTLMRNFDHMDCGIYAEVIAGGEIAPGDEISRAQPGLPL